MRTWNVEVHNFEDKMCEFMYDVNCLNTDKLLHFCSNPCTVAWRRRQWRCGRRL